MDLMEKGCEEVVQSPSQWFVLVLVVLPFWFI